MKRALIFYIVLTFCSSARASHFIQAKSLENQDFNRSYVFVGLQRTYPVAHLIATHRGGAPRPVVGYGFNYKDDWHVSAEMGVFEQLALDQDLKDEKFFYLAQNIGRRYRLFLNQELIAGIGVNYLVPLIKESGRTKKDPGAESEIGVAVNLSYEFAFDDFRVHVGVARWRGTRSPQHLGLTLVTGISVDLENNTHSED